jgi:hypothetical protein
MAALQLALTLARFVVGQALRRMGVTLGLWALAFLFALIGIMGLALAGFIALAEAWGPLAAALMLGCGGLVLSLLLGLIARRRRHLPDLFGPETTQLRQTLQGQKSELAVWLPLVGLAVLGFLLGSGKKD